MKLNYKIELDIEMYEYNLPKWIKNEKDMKEYISNCIDHNLESLEGFNRIRCEWVDMDRQCFKR